MVVCTKIHVASLDRKDDLFMSLFVNGRGRGEMVVVCIVKLT